MLSNHETDIQIYFGCWPLAVYIVWMWVKVNDRYEPLLPRQQTKFQLCFWYGPLAVYNKRNMQWNMQHGCKQVPCRHACRHKRRSFRVGRAPVNAKTNQKAFAKPEFNVSAGWRSRIRPNHVSGRSCNEWSGCDSKKGPNQVSGCFWGEKRVSAGRISSPRRISGSKARGRSGLRQLGSETAGAHAAISGLLQSLPLTQCRMEPSPISGSSVLLKCKKWACGCCNGSLNLPQWHPRRSSLTLGASTNRLTLDQSGSCSRETRSPHKQPPKNLVHEQ